MLADAGWARGTLRVLQRAPARAHALRELTYVSGALAVAQVQIYYNRERAQAGLGHLSPLDYEASLVVA